MNHSWNAAGRDGHGLQNTWRVGAFFMSNTRKHHVKDVKEDTRLMPERTIPIEEAAELYGTSVYTLRNWVSDGLIKGYRFGPRFLRLDIDDLEALFVPIGPEDM